CQQFDTYPRTF
nr:immunoglobulin light chain junction region [Macaca mulatta]